MKENSLAETIAFGPPLGKNYERRMRYIGDFCLERGKSYKLRMKDRNNDGLVSCTLLFLGISVCLSKQHKKHCPLF